MTSNRPVSLRALSVLRCSLLLILASATLSCGGQADPPQPVTGGTPVSPPPAVVAPTVTAVANQSVQVGQTAAFTEVATGSAPLTYQWSKNGSPIEGATGATYTTPATVAGDSGATFSVAVANSAGSVSSAPATLTVIVPALTITQDPASLTVASGAIATFTVAATCNVGSVTWQWQRNSAGGDTFTAIAGATTATYSLMAATSDNAGLFYAVASCANLTAMTNSATLTVTSPTASSAITLSRLPTVGLADQAQIGAGYAIDQLPDGSFAFVAGSSIKRLSADLSTITPIAGQPYGAMNNLVAVDGPASTAAFNFPQGLTHDATGNIYVADTRNCTIRKIAIDGTVSTIAGTAGTCGLTVDGTGAAAEFSQPVAIAMGPDGDLYVADTGNNQIRRVTTAGVVTTYAGSGTFGGIDGPPLTAQFYNPSGVAVAGNGDVYVSDPGNRRVRRIVRSGGSAASVETTAGDITGTSLQAGADANQVDLDGTGTAAEIVGASGMYMSGNTLTVRDIFGLLRQIDVTSKVVTTFSGSRTLGAGYADGPVPAARISTQGGVTAGAGGVFLLIDYDEGSGSLRVTNPDGSVKTIASDLASTYYGSPTGTALLAQLPLKGPATDVQGLRAIAVDPAGNVAVLDQETALLRRISPTGIVTLAGGLFDSAAGLTGSLNPTTVDGVGSAAQFAYGAPAYMDSDSAGILYASDNYGIRKITTDNNVTLLTGSRTTQGAVDGNASTALFTQITGLAVEAAGNILVSDNHAIRRIDAAGNVTTIAGALGQAGTTDGPAALARFSEPGQIAINPDGSILVVETTSGLVRKISSDGATVSTLAVPNDSVKTIKVDAAGTLYYGSSHTGFMMLPVGGQPTVLVPVNASNMLGTTPNATIAAIEDIGILGPKTFVIIAENDILTVTLP